MSTSDASRDLLNQVLSRLRVVRGPDARGEHTCWCPFHPDGQGKPPHQPNLQVSERGYLCHACQAKGGLRQLAERLGVSVGGADGPQEVAYDYRDESGNLLYQVCRYPGKKFLQRRPNRSGGWSWNLRGVRRVLYRLPELVAAPDATVHITEGEKDADRLAREGLTATTNSGGAGKWREEYVEALEDRDVVVLPDNDESGRKHARKVARALHGKARSIKVIELPDLPEKGDVSDWLAAGHTVEELKAVVEATAEWQPANESATPEQSGEADTKNRPSQADRLVNLVVAGGVELFHDDLGEGFVRIPVRSHWEVWRCRSKDFRRWLARRFWQSEEKAPSSDALSAATNVIEAKARFEGEEHPLHNRAALHESAIWYDLADSDWRAVRVTASGWEIVAEPPILFRRYAHQRPNPEPVRGGDLHDLLGFVNLRDPSQGLLLLVCVVCSFVPGIPHPIPVPHGPQGSAKTTLFRMVRRLIDPSAVEVLSFPRDPSELVQQLSHHWAPYYDNISSMPGWISDILCRAVTGEGFSKRELYSDDEDIIYQFRRCVGLNGVNVAAHKPDLLDRCILFGLEPISPARRRPEEEMWRQFEAARPRLLGAILDALARAIELRDSISLPCIPRMADFALWGCAVARALGHSADEFIAAYEGNTEARNEEALQASPVAAMIMELMGEQAEWEVTPTELLAELEALAEQHRVNVRSSAWPKAPHALSRRLNEVRPNLAAVGIEVAMRRDGRRRTIAIRKVATDSVSGVTTVTDDDEAPELVAPRHDATSTRPATASPTASPGEALSDATDENGDAGDAGDAISAPSGRADDGAGSRESPLQRREPAVLPEQDAFSVASDLPAGPDDFTAEDGRQ